MRSLVRAWVASVVLGGCALTPTAPEAPAPARVAIEVHSGFAERLEDRAPRVEMLVDVTTSMQARSGSGPSHVESALDEAESLLQSLPEGSEITLRALGHRSQQCDAGERLIGLAIPTDRGSFAHRLRGLEPRAEGSLAAALEDIGRDLEGRRRALRGTRVVVFTDLDDSCGGDLCEAARSVVGAGGWLEVMTVGEAALPTCLAELGPDSGGDGPVPDWLNPPAPAFVVESRHDDALVTIAGRPGKKGVEVSPGLITVRIDLDPPEDVGPFRLGPGELALVRLLDFPGAVPPMRTWRVERGGEAVATAFPPPLELGPVTDPDAVGRLGDAR